MHISMILYHPFQRTVFSEEQCCQQCQLFADCELTPSNLCVPEFVFSSPQRDVALSFSPSISKPSLWNNKYFAFPPHCRWLRNLSHMLDSQRWANELRQKMQQHRSDSFNTGVLESRSCFGGVSGVILGERTFNCVHIGWLGVWRLRVGNEYAEKIMGKFSRRVSLRK